MSRGSVGARFARGAFWALAGTLIAQGLGVLASIVTARLLGKEVFGEFGMVNSTLGAFGAFAGLGLGLTATKYVAEWRETAPLRAGQILGLSNQVAIVSGGSVALVLFAFSPLLASRTLSAPDLVNELRMGCVLLFLNALNGAQTGALSGLEAFRAITRVNLARGLVSFPVMIAGVWFFGLSGAVAATVIVGAVGWGLNHIALRRECARCGILVIYRGTRAYVPLLWRFSLPAVLSGVMVGPVLWMTRAILVNQPNGYGELGVLNAATQWRTALMFLPSVFMQVALPMMASSLDADESRGSYRRTLLIAQSLTIAVIMPLGTLLMFLSDWIMGLYGSGFADGGVVLIGVVCSIMIASMGSVIGAAIESKGRMWLALALNMSWAVTLTVLVWILAPKWGAIALAYGGALAYLVQTSWGFIYLAPDLPRGMLRRVLLALASILCTTIACVASPASSRAALAAPAVLLSIALCVFALVDPSIRRTGVDLIRASVRRATAAPHVPD